MAGTPRPPLFPLLCLAIAALAFSSCANQLGWSLYPEDLGSIDLGMWKEDLAALEKELALHPKLRADPALAQTIRQAISAAAERLELRGEGDPALADLGVAEVRRILALVGDGHTRINASPRESFPFILRFFPAESLGGASPRLEGFADWEARLVATDPANQSYLGAKILSVGGKDIAEAAEDLAEFLSLEGAVRSGKASALLAHAIRNEVMQSFADPSLVRGAGLAPAQGPMEVLILPRDADPMDPSAQVLLSLEPQDMAAQGWKTVLQAVPAQDRHFTRSGPGLPWWHASPPDREDVLYLRYDDCDSQAWDSLSEVLALLPDKGSQNQGPSRLVVDLRYNSGGNSMPGTRFAKALGSKRVSEVPGGVVVLVSAATFSSAMQNTADILKACGARGVLGGGGDGSPGTALLLGEPLVEPLRHYGEVRRFALPNSGLVVGRSSKLWRYDAATDIYPARGVLEPEAERVVVPVFAEYASGGDPAFDAALALP